MRSRAAVVCLLSLLFPLAACGGPARSNQSAAQLAFGVDMARRGLWNEALFRFQEAEKLDPQNPRIQSNMGVAYEAAGQFDKALEYYQKALRLAPNDKEIRANYGRFVEFYQGFKGDKTAKTGAKTGDNAGAPKADAPAAGPGVTTDPGTAGDPRQPGAAPLQVPPSEEPSTPEDTPPPPADNRPPR
jgi:tetratricopeptide (TPR) repeat protein